MNRLIIIGASGHGKVVADIAKKNGYTDIVFLDDNENLTSCAGYPVIGTDEKLNELEGDVFVAIGKPRIRQQKMERFSTRHFPVLIHPSAVIADDAEIGVGSVIMPGVVINPGTTIGVGCILNTCCSIDHDNTLGDFVHISVGSHLSGTVRVGTATWIGAGATVTNNIDICEDCIIGAGAVVIKNITQEGVYVGVPAKIIQP